MLMAIKAPLPVGHPPMSRFVCANSSVLDFLKTSCPISVSNSHPPLDAAINGSEPFPANHLKMHATLAPYMPLNHRCVGAPSLLLRLRVNVFCFLFLTACVCVCRDIDMLMATGVPLPGDHPSVDPYVCNKTLLQMDICYNHPEIHTQMIDANWAGYRYPVGHKSISAWAAELPGYPFDHDNVDELLMNAEQYGLDHPNVDKYVKRRHPSAVCYNFSVSTYPDAGVCQLPTTRTMVPAWHPMIDASINDPLKVYPVAHPRAHVMLGAWMPLDHT